MPRYRFAVLQLDGPYEECIALLQDDLAARDYARQAIRDLKESGNYRDPTLRIVITNEAGEICTVHSSRPFYACRSAEADRLSLGRTMDMTGFGAPMPPKHRTKQKKPGSKRKKPTSPACRYCGGSLKLVGTQPPERYPGLRVETYECESCGEKSTVVVRLA